jgi:hypothetical protein
MVIGCKLSKDDESIEENQTLYRSMIGNLLYVTASRSDIMQAIGLVVHFQAAPKETHVQEVKRIFNYINGSLDFVLWYLRSDISLTTYIDENWAGNIYDRKSTSGGSFFLGNSLVSWFRKKHYLISLSTTEAKYIAIASCCTEVLWMKKTLRYVKVEYDHPISIICDNTSAINISKNPIMHSKTKHPPIKYHFLREQVEKQNFNMEYVSTK